MNGMFSTLLSVGIIMLKNGDKVKVHMSLKEFQALQKDSASQIPSGWSDDMKQVNTRQHILYYLIY